MLKELEQQETSELTVQYSGTTLENFLACASFDERGNVRFDKLREPNHNSEYVFFTDSFITASLFAREYWKELGQTPLVMEGKLSKKSPYQSHLERGEHFPVDAVYLLKPEHDWSNVEPAYFEGNPNGLKEYLQRLEPEDILSEM